MMDFFKSWALGVCLAALSCAIVYSLAPKGNVQKALRITLSLIMISSLVLPLFNMSKKTGQQLPYDGSADIGRADELERTVMYQLTAEYSVQVSGMAEKVLSSAGFSDCEIDVLTDINDNGGIFIKKADIRLPDGSKQIDDGTYGRLYEIFGKDAVIDIS